MTRRCVAVAVALAAAHAALATVVIREWGGHDLSEFTIDWDGYYNDVGVVIFADHHPGQAFKFEAFDSETEQPADIQYIRIADGVSVTNITVLVVGNPDAEPPYGPHTRGARNVWQIDLLTNGDATNSLAQLDLAGNYGHVQYGNTLRAGPVGSIQIDLDVITPPAPGGGRIPAFDLTEPGCGTGSVTIGRDVYSPLHFGYLTGPLTVEGLLLGSLTVDMEAQDINLLGEDAVGDITIGDSVGNVYMAGGYYGTFDVYQLQLGCLLRADGDLDTLNIRRFYAGTTVSVAGAAHSVWLRTAGGTADFGAVDYLTIQAPTTSGTYRVWGRCGSLWIDSDVFTGDIALGELGIGELTLIEGSFQVLGDITDYCFWGAAAGDIRVGCVPTGATFQLGDVGFGEVQPTGYVQVDQVQGTMTVGDVRTEVVISGKLSGDLSIASVSPYGRIEIGGPTDTPMGTLSVEGDLAGKAVLPAGATGAINLVSLSGEVDVGDGDGEAPFAGSLIIADGMTGNVFLWNGFAHNPLLGEGVADVQIASKAADALFVVNVDGRNRGEEYWQYGAMVRIGTEPPYETYGGPDTGANLWDASCCKGDADGSGDLNVLDIDPFVLLLSSQEDYCDAYPGLCLSATYRGDLNCDGVVNSSDLDPFVLKLTDPTAWYDLYPANCDDPNFECCPGCGGSLMAAESSLSGIESESETTPDAVAGLLTTFVAPEHLDALLSLVQDAAAQSAGTPRGDFWAAVAERISPQ